MQYELQKRVLDIIIAFALIVMFLPFWFVIPFLIYLESGFPIFFKHKRVGKDGREFDIYKFRSMVVDADEILHKPDSAKHDRQLLEKFKKSDWKIANDPRITKLGRALRSLTIDEFPQLFNVLVGDMSMVGPRAYVRKELEEQSERYPETKKYIQAILSVKPGVSGPWQVSGRNEIPFAQRAALDAQYAKKRSIWVDIMIILKTPQAMISKW